MIVSRRAFLRISAVLGASVVVPLKLFPEHPELVEIADEHLVVPDLNIWCTAANEISGPCLITRFHFGFDKDVDGLADFALRRPGDPLPVWAATINKRTPVYFWDAATRDSEVAVLAGGRMLVESPDSDMVHLVYYRRPGPDGKYIEPTFAEMSDDFVDEGCCELDA